MNQHVRRLCVLVFPVFCASLARAESAFKSWQPPRDTKTLSRTLADKNIWTSDSAPEAPRGNEKVRELAEWLQDAVRLTPVPPVNGVTDVRLEALKLDEESWSRAVAATERELSDTNANLARLDQEIKAAKRRLPTAERLRQLDDNLKRNRDQLRVLQDKSLAADTQLALARRNEDAARLQLERAQASLTCWVTQWLRPCGTAETSALTSARQEREKADVQATTAKRAYDATNDTIKYLDREYAEMQRATNEGSSRLSDALAGLERRKSDLEKRQSSQEADLREKVGFVEANRAALRASTPPSLCARPLIYRWPRNLQTRPTPFDREGATATNVNGEHTLVVCLNARGHITSSRAVDSDRADLVTSEVIRDQRGRVTEVILRDARATELEHHYWLSLGRLRARYALSYRDENTGRNVSVYRDL